MPFILAGAAVFVLISGVSYLIKNNRDKKQPKGVKGRAKAAAQRANVASVDVEMAQRRAADLAHELAGRGRQGVAQARAVSRDIDIEAARRAATDVLHSLEARSKDAPTAARSALGAAEKARAKAAKDVRRKSKNRSTGELAIRTALSLAPMMLSQAAKRGGKKKRGLTRAWRS